MRSNFREAGPVFDAVPVGIAVIDAETGVVRDANDAFCDLLGCGREAISGRGLGDLSADGWTPAVPLERRLEAAREGSEPTFEWQCRPGEATLTLAASLSAMETDGETYLALTVRDVEADGDRRGDPRTGEAGNREDGPETAEDDEETRNDGTAAAESIDDRERDGETDPDRDRDHDAGDEPPATPLTEAELRAVYHSVRDAIYVHDADGDVIDANRRAAELYGYSRERLREGAVAETSASEPPYTPETARDRLRRAADGEDQTFEWRGEDSDGNEFWEEVTLTRTTVDGDPRVLAMVRDVDERKRYERELEYRRALLEAQAEATIDGILVVDEDRNVVSYNDRFLEIWDVPAEIASEGDSEQLIEYVLEEVADPEAFRETVEYLYDHPGEERRDEIEMADGRWLDRYSGPVVGEDGTQYGRLWVFRDVTERKQRERELREQNDRLQALFANSRAAIVEYVFEDGRPVVVSVNDRFEEVFGYDAETVTGRSLDEFIVPPESEREEEASRLNRKVERGEYLRTEVQRVTADGVRSFLLRNAPIDTEAETRGYASYTDITERKERERELREQREKYSTLVEQSHEGVVIVQDKEFAFVNSTMADLTGYARDDLVGSEFTTVIAPEYRDLVERRYEQRLQGETPPQRYDVELLTADGDRRHVDLKVSAIQYEGEPATLATFNDITERKQRERELADLTTRLQLALEGTNTGVWEWDVETDEVIWDEQMERLFGYDPGEFPGTYEAFLDGVHPLDVDDVEAAVERALETGEYRAEFRVLDDEATERWVDARAEVTYEDGDPVRMIGIVTDVTEHKQREQELEDLNARLQLALDETDTGVWEWNLDTDDLFWDEGSKRLFGYDTDSFPGAYRAFAERVHPEDLPDVEEQIDHAIETGELYQADFRVQLPGGDQRWVQSRGMVEYDENGEPERMFGVQTDITDRKQFERSLEAKNKKLELLNRIVRHDIRNDMTVARGRAEVLEEYVDEPVAREQLDAIVESADHVVELTEIVRDLMATMLEEGEATDPVDLRRTLREEFEVVRSMDDAVLDPPESIPPVAVTADEMLGTVFRNLLTNAVRHNDTDQPHVSVSVTEREEEVLVLVADDGPGVPDSMKDDIFGRGEKGLESPGTGVGLYLVDTLVEGYGGEVWVEDNDPRGAVFVVALPTAGRRDEGEWAGTE